MQELDLQTKWDVYHSEGKIYHGVGLVDFWLRGYSDDVLDPPVLRPEFLQWLEAHGCKLVDWGAFGPPAIQFPDGETADLFREEWHRPGLVQAQYYERWCQEATEFDYSAEENEAAMQRARQARADWLAQR